MEDLNKMIQGTPGEPTHHFQPDADTVESEEVKNEEDSSITIDEIQETSANENIISIISLKEWIEKHWDKFSNIHQVQAAIRNVDPNKHLILSYDDPEGKEITPGNKERYLKLYTDASSKPVLDLEPVDMQIYNNGFRVIYSLNETDFVKMYGVKTSLFAIFCYSIDGGLVPFSKTVAKRKDNTIEIKQDNIDGYIEEMKRPINMENLKLLYKQCSKVDPFETKGQAVNWLLSRQDSIKDINHHLEIDNTIMTILLNTF